MKFLRIFILHCVVAFCASSVSAAEVKVAVALSFQSAFDELTALYESKNKGVKIHGSYDTSQALAKQIASGVKVDLYISAHQQWIDYLKMGKHIDDLLVKTFASNSLVFIGLPGKNISNIQDLRLLKRIAIGNPITTAHGQYTMDALRKAGLEPDLKNRFITGNAVENISRVERGEADGAILYRTETTRLKKARILFPILPSLYPPISYQVSMIKSSVDDPAVLGFYKFLTGAEAKPVLLRHGFGVR